MSDLSLSSRARSIGFAVAGLRSMLMTQPNVKIHLAMTLLVLLLAALFGIHTTEWAIIILAIAIVWIAEALNTAFEFVCDVVSPEFNPQVKQAKDIAAAGVLVAAGGAAIVGALVFVPHILAAMGAH